MKFDQLPELDQEKILAHRSLREEQRQLLKFYINNSFNYPFFRRAQLMSLYKEYKHLLKAHAWQRLIFSLLIKAKYVSENRSKINFYGKNNTTGQIRAKFNQTGYALDFSTVQIDCLSKYQFHLSNIEMDDLWIDSFKKILEIQFNRLITLTPRNTFIMERKF